MKEEQNLCLGEYIHIVIGKLHFRLLYDNIFLPYGCLNKARRHFRMLSMMEGYDANLSFGTFNERRVFKINVGN